MTLPIRRFAAVAGIAIFLILGLFLLPSLSSAQSSNDPNFTPVLLKSSLSFPDGVVFRPPTGDLLITRSGANQVSSINPNSAAINTFATTSANPDKIAVRSTDGLVAVLHAPFGPVDFFSSTGASVSTVDLGADIINAPGSLINTTVACLSGLSFDTAGNLFVAAGPGDSEGGGCTLDATWYVYEFTASTLFSAPPTIQRITNFTQGAIIQDMVFVAAPPPAGTLYAVDSEQGQVFEIALFCGECAISATPLLANNISASLDPRGIAVDPLLGDIYITEFTGTEILRIPAPKNLDGSNSYSTFATGFSNNPLGNTLRLAFDTNGNLYVNEYGAGNLWKFTRASSATAQLPVTQGVINTLAFINPAAPDQMQNMLIPASANLNGVAYIQDIFVSVNPTTLDATLSGGTLGDTTFFGGAPVPPGTMCLPIPTANLNCVAVIQKCYNANHIPFEICPVQEPFTSPDLIQLTFTFAGTQPPAATSAFLIGFDDGDGQDITDITIADCCSGGTKSLCSKTFAATVPAGSGEFSLGLAPDPVNLTTSNPASAAVTVTSFENSSLTISLSVVDVPVGFTATLNRSSVTLTAPGSDSSTTLTVGISQSATISGLTTLISNLLAAGCIDNAGIANAFTSKLSAAQNDISSGQIRTGINVLMAFRDQVSAQSNKHLASSCTTTFPLLVDGFANQETRSASTNIIFSPAAVIATNVAGLITSLKSSISSADPITGFVMDSNNNAIQNIQVQLFNSSNLVTPLATASTDATGFYFFATTGSLAVGSSYTILIPIATLPPQYSTVTPTYPPFTWSGKGLAFNFTLQ